MSEVFFIYVIWIRNIFQAGSGSATLADLRKYFNGLYTVKFIYKTCQNGQKFTSKFTRFFAVNLKFPVFKRIPELNSGFLFRHFLTAQHRFNVRGTSLACIQQNKHAIFERLWRYINAEYLPPLPSCIKFLFYFDANSK